MKELKTSPESFEDPTSSKNGSQCNKLPAERDYKKVPPDGGWGWMIVLGSFLAMVLGTSPVFAFSILFSPILMSHEVSSTKIAWIYNVHSLIWCLCTIVIGPLCDEFGWRKIAIFGGATNFLSVFLSSFAPNPDYLFFSFSFLGGIGGSSALSLSFFVVSRYFEKHRGFALGITTLGSCTSSFVAPLMANYLLEHYGYMGGSLIFAAIVLNQCVGGALYQPVEWHMKLAEADSSVENEILIRVSAPSEPQENLKVQMKCLDDVRRLSSISAHSSDSYCQSSVNISALPTLSEGEQHKKGKDIPKVSESKSALKNIIKSTYNNIKSLKSMRVNLISVAYCGLVLGYINFQMWIPFVITNAGFSLEMAAWCSSLASLGNVFGRIVTSLLSDRKFFNVKYGYMFGIFLIGSSIVAFSLVNDITLYMISTCGWGLGIGSAMALHVTAMIEVMGVEMLPAVLGVSSLFKGFGGLAIGVLTGVVRDATSSYTYSLWMLGACELVAFCMWLLMPCGERFDQRKLQKGKKKNELQNS